MASELIVQTIQGPSSGANANKVIIPSGHTLAAAGHVVQVVSAKHSSQSQTTGTSYIGFPLSASITPTSASSKILVILSFTGAISTDNHLIVRVLRDSTTAVGENLSAFFAQTAGVSGGALNIHELDTPNTTSTLTYEAQFRSRDAGENVLVQYSNQPSTLTLMEIAQ